jgi:iron complex outermembrane recepter protein
VMRRLSGTKNKALLHGAILVGALVGSTLGGTAAARDAYAGDGDDSGEGASIAEITVTAQKRAENIQNVPVTVTAFGRKFLQRTDEIATANDIANFVPNFTAAATDGRERPRWFIRGVGTNNTAASTVSPVGVYIDEVYISNVFAQAFPIFDLERIEVLSGPQGTLWGKNSTGGAISYISKLPTFELDSYAKLTVGSNNEIDEQGAISGPLIAGKLAGRVSFFNQKSDGWVRNRYDGGTLGEARDTAVRAQLLATPTDALTIQLSAHFRDYDGDPYPFEYRPDFQYAPPRNFGYDDGGEYGVKNSSQRGTNKIENKGALLKINWQPGDYAFTSITAFERNVRTNNTVGSASTPIVNASAYSTNPDQQWSQELRITSPRAERFNWIAGLYWFDESLTADSFTGNTNPNEGVPTSSGLYTPLSWNETYGRTRTKSYSAYGSATYDVTDRLKLTAGARLGIESKDFLLRYSYAPQTLQVAGVPYVSGVNFTNPAQWWVPSSVTGTGNSTIRNASVANDSHTWRYATWDATPSYKIADNALAYFRYSRGFLSGGFASTTSGSAASQNIAAQIQPYQPEHISTYELGVKTSWFDRRLVVNASAFYYDYSSIQVLVIVPSTTINGVSNSGSAGGYQNAAGNVKGLELSVDAQPFEHLHLQGALGLLDTEYTSYPLTSVPTLPITLPPNYVAIGGGRYAVNPVGGAFTRAPNVTINVGVDYTIPLNWGGWVRLAADYQYRSHQYFNPTFENDPTLVQPGYGLTNARVNWAVDDSERFEVGFTVLNLLDQKYLDHAIAPSNGVSATQQGKPRTFLGSLTARF